MKANSRGLAQGDTLSSPATVQAQNIRKTKITLYKTTSLKRKAN